MESIIDFLRRRLKEAGLARWNGIVEGINATIESPEEYLTYHGLRKIAYGERDNPGLKDVQALLDYFTAVDRGEIDLPEEVARHG